MPIITALTSITGANVADGDVFPLVDISDTSMAATGTDKKITRNELKAALSVEVSAIVYAIALG